jgi:hypothetical protein
MLTKTDQKIASELQRRVATIVSVFEFWIDGFRAKGGTKVDLFKSIDLGIFLSKTLDFKFNLVLKETLIRQVKDSILKEAAI